MAASRRYTDRRDGGFYKCEECSKWFNRMASYEAHIRMHAADELDIYDVVFNYSGKMTPSGPNRRETKSRTSANLAKSPTSTSPPPGTEPPPQRSSTTSVSDSNSTLGVVPLDDPDQQDVTPTPATPTVSTSVADNDSSPRRASKPQVVTLPVTLQPTSKVTSKTLPATLHSTLKVRSENSVAINESPSAGSSVLPANPSVITITSESESETESLLVKVPLRICSAGVMGKPVINLSQKNCLVDWPKSISKASELLQESALSQSEVLGGVVHPLQKSSQKFQQTPVRVELNGSKYKSVIHPNPPPKKVARVIRLDTTITVPETSELRRRLSNASAVKPEGPPLKQRRRVTTTTRFQCSVCRRLLANNSSLKRHNLLHTGERPFKCSTCNRTFVQQHHCQKHELTHFEIRQQGGGSVSSSVSSSSENEVKVHKCSVCNMQFAGIRSLKHHLSIHDTSRPFRCDVCGMRFLKKIHHAYHMQTHSERKYICRYCNKKFNRQEHLDRHMLLHFHNDSYTNTVTGQVKYMCKYCPKICRSLSGLTRHRNVHMSAKQEQKFSSIRDGEVFPLGMEMESDSMEENLGITDTETEGELADVSSEGTGAEESAEEFVRPELSEKSNLFGEMHGLGDSEESDCEMGPLQLDSEDDSSDDDDAGRQFIQCGSEKGRSEGYSSGTSYVGIPYRNPHNHRKGNGGIPKYKCEWCGRMFLRRSYLREHYILHKQVPHQCNICGKVFMTLRYLKRHLACTHNRCETVSHS